MRKCPLIDEELDADDCLEITDIIDGMVSDVSRIENKFKAKKNFEDICKNCPEHVSTWG